MSIEKAVEALTNGARVWAALAALDEAKALRDEFAQRYLTNEAERDRLAAEVERLRADAERTIRELEAHRLYARALCKAVDAATDFAGTVAGGAAWWDDMWADHAAALDRARDRITDAAIDAAMTGEGGA